LGKGIREFKASLSDNHDHDEDESLQIAA